MFHCILWRNILNDDKALHCACFRLLNDLLLWEPAAPIPMDTQEPHTFGYGGGWSPEFVPQMMQQGQIDATSYCTGTQCHFYYSVILANLGTSAAPMA